jgi:hypothetical protein
MTWHADKGASWTWMQTFSWSLGKQAELRITIVETNETQPYIVFPNSLYVHVSSLLRCPHVYKYFASISRFPRIIWILIPSVLTPELS